MSASIDRSRRVLTASAVQADTMNSAPGGLSKLQLLQAFSGRWRSYSVAERDYKSGSTIRVGY